MAVIRFGPFAVDLRAGELRKEGKKIRLQQQPLRLLVLLLEHPGEVVTREELRQAIWPTHEFGSFDEGLDAAVYKLRSALGDSAEKPRFVETLPRRGYRFIGTIDGVTSSVPRRSWHAPIRKPFILTGGVAAALALALSLRAGPTGRHIHSLVVLPLANMSGDSTQEYVADGMTETLITDLGKIAGLRVISRTSAMHYKGTRETLPAIGRELHVDAVVEGSVLRSGDRVRVTAQLVEAPTDRHLWAETYERDVRDVLGLEDAVARAITNEVQLRLADVPGRGSVATTNRTRPVDPDAYDLYLRGRREWDTWTENGVRASIVYFERAIQRDSSYAPAWAGLSDAYGGLAGSNSLPSEWAWRKADTAARRAIQLDDSLSDAHASLAMVLAHLYWSWPAAEQEFRRAIALNSNNAFAHQQYGDVLSRGGQFDAAIREMQRALELDPLSPNKQSSVGAALYRAGRYDEALQLFLQVPDPDFISENRHRRIAVIYERQGKLPQAMAEWLTALKISGKQDLAASVDSAYRASGYAAAKRVYLWADVRDKERRAQNPYPRPRSLDIAADYALLGERAKAYEWIDKAFREREWPLMYLMVDDRFETLRQDARFRNLAGRLGLPVSMALSSRVAGGSSQR
ncbi:MAG TPA: winged helix-turn-helix domain-containing protein [Gemmatimonadales bacterium]|nr:winged helix-turn-helix domain-containing protein [Gemmatimonadales bacterium]